MSQIRLIERKLFDGLVTAAVLAVMLYNGPFVNALNRWRHLPETSAGQIRTYSDIDPRKVKAFKTSQSYITSSFGASATTIAWCDVTQANFIPTPPVAFVVLQAQVTDLRGQTSSHHWIMRLDPKTYNILGNVHWVE